MTSPDTAVVTRPRSASLRPSIVGAVLVALAPVLIAPLYDKATIRPGQGSADFGLPFAWVHQDVTGMSPPGPVEVGFLSPWEHPVGLSILPFFANLVLALGAVGVVGSAVLLARRRLAGARGA